MGCSPSHPRKSINLNSPAHKNRKSSLPLLFIGNTQISTQPFTEKNSQTDVKEPLDTGTLLISLSIPGNQSISKEPREFRDEPGSAKVRNRGESIREFSFKAISDSCSSLDSKEGTFSRQTSNKSGPTSLRNSPMQTKETTMFLFPMKPSEFHLKRFDTSESLQVGSPNHAQLKIENISRSAQDLSNVGSSSSLKNDSPTGTPAFHKDPESFKLGGVPAITNIVLKVPEERKSEEKKANIPSPDSKEIKKYIQDSFESPKSHPFNIITIKKSHSFGIREKIIVQSPNERVDRDMTEKNPNSVNQITKPLTSMTPRVKRIIEPKTPDDSTSTIKISANISKVLSPETTQPQYSDSFSALKVEVQNEKIEEESPKKTGVTPRKRVSLPLNNLVSEFLRHQPNQQSQKETKNQAILSPGLQKQFTQSKNQQNNGFSSLTNSPKANFQEESNNKQPKFVRKNSRQRSEAGTFGCPSIPDEEGKFTPQIKSKFRTNLLDLVSSKRSSTVHSAGLSNQIYQKTGFADYLEDMSNISVHTSQKTLLDSERIKSETGDNIPKSESHSEELESYRTPKLQKLELFKLSETISPIFGSAKVFEDEPPLASDRSLLFPKVLDTSPTNFDRSIGAVEDVLDNFDLENYTIVEEIKNVEIDEKSGVNIYRRSKQRPATQYYPHQSLKMSRFGNETEAKAKTMSSTDSNPYNFNSNFINQKRREEPVTPPPVINKKIEKIEQPVTSFPEPKLKRAPSGRFRRRVFTVGPQTSEMSQNAGDKTPEGERQRRINQYMLEENLGNGTLGEAKLGINSDTQNACVVKIISQDKLQKKFSLGTELNQLKSEIALLKKMSHPNIAKFYEAIDDSINNKMYIITEFCPREDIFSIKTFPDSPKEVKEQVKSNEKNSPYLKKPTLSEEKIRRYFRELLLGIDYIHNYANFTHGNLKPENVAIYYDSLKILDCSVPSIMQNLKDRIDKADVSESFLPPEAWKNDAPSKAKSFDIWGIGALLYYFVYELPPFCESSPSLLKKKVMEDDVIFPQDIKINRSIKQLIKSCMQKDPSKRPTLKDIMEDPWVTKNWKETLSNEECEVISVTAEDIRESLIQRFHSHSLKPSRFGRGRATVIIQTPEQSIDLAQ